MLRGAPLASDQEEERMQNGEPDEIIDARELLSEFEKAPALSKITSFSEGIEILKDVLAEHPNSKFSPRVRNLIKRYTKVMIQRLGKTPISDYKDWLKALAIATKAISQAEIEADPELKPFWQKFIVDNFPYLKV